MMLEMHAYISGMVQGVGFRYTTLQHAKNLKLTGLVRNLSDGRVEIIAQGSRQNLEQLIHLLKTQGGASQIEHAELKFYSAVDSFSTFVISR